ncbi:MAG: signal peptidase I, partial [Anaerolineales bacterium]|nr:signal peptidase I [Anaerolineales bacterium]
VIVFRHEGSEFPYIKRIIALPGETVEIKDDKVFINGIALEEEYVMESPHYTMPPEEIPKDEYFVLGDNRNSSSDSHSWGTVPLGNVIGKAEVVYWPPTEWKLLNEAVAAAATP